MDDHPDSAETFAALLVSMGHEARFTLDPLKVATLARSFRPQIIFLDLSMPGLDGYALAAALRKEHGFDELKLVAVTADGKDEARRRARQAGFDAHVLKPVDPHLVEAMLSQLER